MALVLCRLRAHHRNQDALRHAITRHEREITRLTGSRRTSTPPSASARTPRARNFTMTFDGRRHVKRAEAGQHLKDLLLNEATAARAARHNVMRLGQLGGFPVTAEIAAPLGQPTITVALEGAPGTDIRIAARDFRSDQGGLIIRLENRLHRLDEHEATTLAEAERARREITHARREHRPAVCTRCATCRGPRPRVRN